MRLHAGANVQLLRPASAVSEGLGEELVQGGQMGAQGVKVWRLPSPNSIKAAYCLGYCGSHTHL